MKYLMTPKRHGLGWIPDTPDQRDITYKPGLKVTRTIPKKVDLRDQMPPIYDQGQLGSCTAQALAAAFDFNRQKQGVPFMDPSRLFIYWNERELEGTVDVDAGAQLRTGVKVLVRFGTPDEETWPYAVKKFAKKPSAAAYEEAERNQTLTYQRILCSADGTCSDMFSCLNEGFPFVTGFTVYESFESAHATKTGMIPLPKKDEQPLGGHAIVVVGYDMAKEHFICRNSWGKDWGDDGYCYMPFTYLQRADLAGDQWTLRSVEV